MALKLECTLNKVNLDRSGLYEDQTGEVVKFELSKKLRVVKYLETRSH